LTGRYTWESPAKPLAGVGVIYAAGAPAKLDTPIECHQNPVVYQAFAHHPLTDSGLIEQLRGRPLQEARADALLNVLARVPLEHNALHSRTMEELGEQQP
jgi:hypothetical protein